MRMMQLGVTIVQQRLWKAALERLLLKALERLLWRWIHGLEAVRARPKGKSNAWIDFLMALTKTLQVAMAWRHHAGLWRRMCSQQLSPTEKGQKLQSVIDARQA